MFAARGETKLDLARYYQVIEPWVMPHLIDRPLTLVRCPSGVLPASSKKSSECFFMKHSKVWAPPAIRRVRIREKTKLGEYLIADSIAALIGLVQMDVLEVHTWNSRFSDIERPDRIVIDLDPGAGIRWPAIVDAARLVRQLLALLDLESFVKTTGGRGLHIAVPLTPRAGWTDCLEFARTFAQALVRRQPALFTEKFAKAGRHDKILVDYLRNNRTNTSIAAFSSRARPEAPVSVPLAWSELAPAKTPERFTIATVPGRLVRLRRDPWEEYWTTRQRIPGSAVRALERM